MNPAEVRILVELTSAASLAESALRYFIMIFYEAAASLEERLFIQQNFKTAYPVIVRAVAVELVSNAALQLIAEQVLQ